MSGKSNSQYKEGISILEASDVFHVQQDDLVTLVKLAELEPISPHRYDIYEVAALVVPPRWTDEEWEKVLTRRSFPPKMTKEFWGAKQARQNYLQSAGELWPTHEVVATLGDVLKTVSMGVKLITDNIERETGLTQKQRDLINEMVDEALRSAAKQLRDKFQERIIPEKMERYQSLTSERVILNGGATKISTTGDTQSKHEPDSSSYDIAEL